MAASAPTTRMRTVLRWAEWGAAVLVSAVLIVCHFMGLTHAGALWRDEVNTLNIAGLPSLSEIWAMLEFDSCPILWHFVLRAWSAAGLGGTDFSLRVLGFTIGLGITGALWLIAKRFRVGVPLVSLVLFGLSPAVLLIGDSLRAYGLGALVILLALSAFWRLVEETTLRQVLIAGLAAVLSVQCLYHNAVILLAMGAGGLAVALRRRAWKTAGAIIGIGLVAALSLVPYLVGPLARAREWNDVIKVPLTIWWLLARFSEAVGGGGAVFVWVWAVLLALAVGACIWRLARPAADASPSQRDLPLFVAVTMVVGVIAYGAFLLAVGYPTSPWYYLSLMALLAVLAEVGVHQVAGGGVVGRLARIGGAVALAAMVLPQAWEIVHIRMTDVDAIAARLEAIAQREDLIVVNPWWPGISFMRYYHGLAPWTTVPDIGDHRVHRYDLVKKKMAESEAIQPIQSRVGETLRSGHRVWLVGGAEFLAPGQRPEDIPRDPATAHSEVYYTVLWSRQLAYFLQTHGRLLTVVRLPAGWADVFLYEALPLMAVEGWRD